MKGYSTIKAMGIMSTLGSNTEIIPRHKRKDNDVKVFQSDLYFVEI